MHILPFRILTEFLVIWTRHPEQQSLSDHFRPSIPCKYRDKLNSMCFRSSEVWALEKWSTAGGFFQLYFSRIFLLFFSGHSLNNNRPGEISLQNTSPVSAWIFAITFVWKNQYRPQTFTRAENYKAFYFQNENYGSPYEIEKMRHRVPVEQVTSVAILFTWIFWCFKSLPSNRTEMLKCELKDFYAVLLGNSMEK